MYKHIFDNKVMLFKKHNRIQSFSRLLKDRYEIKSNVPVYVIFNNRFRRNSNFKSFISAYVFDVTDDVVVEDLTPASIPIKALGCWIDGFYIIKEHCHTYTVYRMMHYSYSKDVITSNGTLLGSSLVSEWAVSIYEENLRSLQEEGLYDTIAHRCGIFGSDYVAGEYPRNERLQIPHYTSDTITNPFGSDMYTNTLTPYDDNIHIPFSKGQME